MTEPYDWTEEVEAHRAVYMDLIPKCQIHGGVHDAEYDANTTLGGWAYLCEEAFDEVGIGLGLGQGQKLLRLDRR